MKNPLTQTLCIVCMILVTPALNGQDGCFEDINRDTKIDVTDYLLLVAQFGSTCSVSLPAITTTTPVAITPQTAIAGGHLSGDGGSVILFRGVCWSTAPNPSILHMKTYEGADTGVFTSQLLNLEQNTNYYIRAYATNSVGTAYGQEISFRTLAGFPEVTTKPVTNITKISAISGGVVTDDGGTSVNVYGVCWSTVQHPTLADDFTTDGVGMGGYESHLSGLNPGTMYYVRAYATNAVGTAYGEEITFITEFPGLTVTDADGNIYQVDTLGNQIWMAENLKTTKYNDGTSIPPVPDNTQWNTRTTPGYCWYNNDMATYKGVYGGLYNWYTINTGKLCPSGWHVPTNEDFTELTTYLDGEGVAGGKLKEAGTTHWFEPNTGATDESGFTALPGGYRRYNGVFTSVTFYGYWWSATELIPDSSWDIHMSNDSAAVVREYSNKRNGFSVRCLKD